MIFASFSTTFIVFASFSLLIIDAQQPFCWFLETYLDAATSQTSFAAAALLSQPKLISFWQRRYSSHKLVVTDLAFYFLPQLKVFVLFSLVT